MSEDIRRLQDNREWLRQAIESAGGKVDGGALLLPDACEVTFLLNGQAFYCELTELNEEQSA
jgi:hypothetical protein